MVFDPNAPAPVVDPNAVAPAVPDPNAVAAPAADPVSVEPDIPAFHVGQIVKQGDAYGIVTDLARALAHDENGVTIVDADGNATYAGYTARVGWFASHTDAVPFEELQAV